MTSIRFDTRLTQIEWLKPLQQRWGRSMVGLALILLFCVSACSAPLVMAAPEDPLPATIPHLPFADNPDPTLCGIPQPDGRQGVVTGEYEGELISEIVYLYDGHARHSITGQVYPGAQVEIVLRQSNPTLDYYFVKTSNVEPAQEGWVPAPFVEIGG